MPPKLLKKTVQALSAAVVLGVIGLISVWTGQALLAPSLASATFIQIVTPREPSAEAWPTAVGQVCGLAGGFAGVFAAAAAGAPPFTHDHPLALARVAATALAAVITAGLQLALKAPSAAGGALAFLLTLGSEPPGWNSAGRLLAGVALVTILGETARQLILGLDRKAG